MIVYQGVLTGAQFSEALASFEHSAFRLEVQPRYTEPEEGVLEAAFTDGHPLPPTTVPGLTAWYAQVGRQVHEEGKWVQRVRVQSDPPTPYQRFERWLGNWNAAAGEDIRYLTEQRAFEIGLLPAAGGRDWWLLDSSRLIVMSFDQAGHRIRNEITTDPERVIQACRWRDLALHHSVPAVELGAAA